MAHSLNIGTLLEIVTDFKKKMILKAYKHDVLGFEKLHIFTARNSTKQGVTV